MADADLRRTLRSRLTPTGGWAALFALFTAIGALEFFYRFFDRLARGDHADVAPLLIEQTTGAWAAFVLLPLVVALCRRFPWRRTGWPRVLGVYVLGALVFSLLHTTLMALSRAILFPLFGLGPYDYGDMHWRYPMEFSNDLIAFAVFVGCTNFLDRIRRDARLQTQLVAAKLANLQLQLQPHFLFNTLNTISAVMYEDPRVADRMIARLADLLRVTLYACEQPENVVGDELHIARLYLEIMQARLEDGLRVEYRIDPDASDALVPTMILQPLLENALRHGLDPDAARLDITVAVRREGDALRLSVADTGVGLGGNSSPGGGVGLSNTRSRLAQLYGAAGALRLDARAEGGVEAVVTLPYRHAAPALAR